MAGDDSMSDDVFESEDSLRAGTAPTTQPSPTGYRGYQPPPELFKDPYTHQEQELPHKVGYGHHVLLQIIDLYAFMKTSIAFFLNKKVVFY